MLYNSFLFLLLLSGVLSNSKINNNVLSSFSWLGGKFHWRCEELETKYRCSGKYLSKNIIATSSQIYKNTFFFALPRFRQGVPATLVNLTLNEKHCDVLFTPYPNLKLNEVGDCKGLQNVVDVFIDSQDLLWVLDTGIIYTLQNVTRKCPAKVLAFNLEAQNIQYNLDLSRIVSKSLKYSSRLQFIVAEYSAEGNSFVYISDATGRSILAYDVTVNKAHRIPLPERITSKIEKCKVLYLLLVHKTCGSFIIFTYLSSCHLYQIRTDHLFEKNIENYIEDLGPKHKSIVFLGSYSSFVFFRYTDERDVYKWDTNKLFTIDNFLKIYSTNDEVFATQVMTENKGKSYRVLESNFPDFIHNNLSQGAFQRVTLIPKVTPKKT